VTIEYPDEDLRCTPVAWMQTRVDNQGGYLDFEGRFRDGRMTSERSAIVQDKHLRQQYHAPLSSRGEPP
jgi:hypothetical protein